MGRTDSDRKKKREYIILLMQTLSLGELQSKPMAITARSYFVVLIQAEK